MQKKKNNGEETGERIENFQKSLPRLVHIGQRKHS